MSVLQQQFIEHVAGGIGRGGARIPRLAILSGSSGMPGNTMPSQVFSICAASSGVADSGISSGSAPLRLMAFK